MVAVEQDEGFGSAQVGGVEERAELTPWTIRQLGLSERHYVRGVVVVEDVEEGRLAEFLRSQNCANTVWVVNADGAGFVVGRNYLAKREKSSVVQIG